MNNIRPAPPAAGFCARSVCCVMLLAKDGSASVYQKYQGNNL